MSFIFFHNFISVLLFIIILFFFQLVRLTRLRRIIINFFLWDWLSLFWHSLKFNIISYRLEVYVLWLSFLSDRWQLDSLFFYLLFVWWGVDISYFQLGFGSVFLNRSLIRRSLLFLSISVVCLWVLFSFLNNVCLLLAISIFDGRICRLSRWFLRSLWIFLRILINFIALVQRIMCDVHLNLLFCTFMCLVPRRSDHLRAVAFTVLFVEPIGAIMKPWWV